MTAMSTETPAAERVDVPPAPVHRRSPWALGIGVAVLAVLLVLPQIDATIPGVLPGAPSSPGSLQVLAIALTFAGLAMSYDVLFGFTGLLSFGHALFFGLSVYGTNLLMLEWGLGYVAAAAVSVLGTMLISLAVGAVALRARGVAFAMVTLAFVEAFAIFLIADPLGITGGEEGLALALDGVPAIFKGVVNASNLYWLALGFAVLTFAVVMLVTRSRAGRVWQAIRENENRVELLGIRPYPAKLLPFVIGSTLAAIGGSVYLLVVRGANPTLATAEFTLTLLVMVVIGGAGRVWGAALGGFVYGLLELRLPDLTSSGVLEALPGPVGRVLSEPLFILGTLFVLLVLFAPNGAAGAVDRIKSSLALRSRSSEVAR